MITAMCPICGSRLRMDGRTLDNIVDSGSPEIVEMAHLTHCEDCDRAFFVRTRARIQSVTIEDEFGNPVTEFVSQDT